MQAKYTAFAAIARLLIAAKGAAHAEADGIGFDHARAQLPRHALTLFLIAALDVIGQTVGRVIGDCDGFLFRIKRHDAHDGAKDFLAVDAGGVVHIRKYGRADIKAAV